MYESFYNFSADPFRISPDPHFSFPHESYLQARNYLEYGLLLGEGLVVVTGDPGTGKSTVINDVLSEYASDDIVITKLVTTQLEVEELLRLLAFTFGIDAEGMDKATVLIRIENFLHEQYAAGKHVLLIIDEAQNLSERTLEELRLLTNIQRDDKLLLQLFLLGQPQLQNLIRSAALAQLRQRLVAACHLEPVPAQEVRHYVEHRLVTVGWEGDPEITDQALDLIHQCGKGIPRRINIICGRLLLYGSVDQKHFLDAADVHEVIEELPPEMVEPVSKPARVTYQQKASNVRARREGTSKYERWYEASRRNAARQAARSVAVDPQNTATVQPVTAIPPRANRVASIRPAEPRRSSDSNDQTIQRRVPVSPASDSGPQMPTPDKPVKEEVEITNKGIEQVQMEEADTEPNIAADIDDDTEARPGSAWRSLRAWANAAVIFIVVFGGTYWFFDWYQNKYGGTLPRFDLLSWQAADKVKGQTGSDAVTNEAAAPPTHAALETRRTDEVPLPEQEANVKLSESTPTQQTDADLRREEHLAVPPNTPIPTDRQEPEKRGTPTADPTEKTPTQRDNGSPTSGVSSQAPSGLAETDAATPNRSGPRATPRDLGVTDAGVVLEGGRPVISRSLEHALRLHAPKVERLRDGSLKVTLDREVPFQSDSAKLNAKASQALNELAFVLRNYDGFVVDIVSHTDDTGPDGYNLDLSKRRARAVAAYLVGQGMPPNRISADGRGEAEPISADGGTGANPSENRRLEIYLKPSAAQPSV